MLCKHLLLVSSALTVAVPAQALLTVGRGTGRFPTIQAAVSAARPGDRIEVLPGTYPRFVVDKGVAIVGHAGATVSVSRSEEFGIVIENVPVDQVAVVSGLDLQGVLANVVVRDNAGRVIVDRIRQTEGSPLEVVRSSRTTVDNCQFGNAATIVGSTDVAIRACRFFVGTPITFTPNGMHMVDSTVELTATSVEVGSFYFGAPAGIQLRDSALRLRGPSNSIAVLVTRAGSGSAIHAAGASSLDMDPATRLRSYNNAPRIQGVTPTLRARPSLHASAQPLPGSVYVELYDGAPGASYALFASLPSGPLALAGLDTPLWIDPASAVLVGAGTVGTGGSASAAIPVVASDGLVARPFCWQAIVFAGGATTELTNAGQYVHWR